MSELVEPVVVGAFRPFERGLNRADANSRRLEDHAVALVIAALRHEGMSITNIHRPDREPEYRPELRRRPDASMWLDGEPVAIEVSVIAPNRAYVRSVARMQALREEALPLLARHAPAHTRLVIEIRYHAQDRQIGKLNGRSLRAAAEALASAVEAAVHAGDLQKGGASIELTALPKFVKAAKATVLTTEDEDGALLWGFFPEPVEVGPALSKWIATTAKAKGSQHEGWGRGILVPVATGIEDPDDVGATHNVREALIRWVAENGQLPWWRVYLLSFAGDGVAPVWP